MRVTYVLVARVGKDDDGERGQCRDGAGPLEDADGSALGHGVASDEMGHDEDHEIGNREQCDDARVLE